MLHLNCHHQAILKVSKSQTNHNYNDMYFLVSTEITTSLTVTTITSTVTSFSLTKTHSTITYSHMVSSTVSTATIPTIIVHTNAPSGTSESTITNIFVQQNSYILVMSTL